MICRSLYRAWPPLGGMAVTVSALPLMFCNPAMWGCSASVPSDRTCRISFYLDGGLPKNVGYFL